jgi:hypothetical protein
VAAKDLLNPLMTAGDTVFIIVIVDRCLVRFTSKLIALAASIGINVRTNFSSTVAVGINPSRTALY